jgi:hypothetical protein
MSDTSRERAPEEKRLLELAARRLPGGVLGSARFPDELAFVVEAALRACRELHR